MATRSFRPSNTFGAVKWHKLTDATAADLPVNNDKLPEVLSGLPDVLTGTWNDSENWEDLQTWND